MDRNRFEHDHRVGKCFLGMCCSLYLDRATGNWEEDTQHLAGDDQRRTNRERKNECTFLEHYYVVFLYVIEMCKTLQRTNIFFRFFSACVAFASVIAHLRDQDDDDDDLLLLLMPARVERGIRSERFNSGEKCANPALLKSGLRCTIGEPEKGLV